MFVIVTRKSIKYQYSDIDPCATLSEGGGCMWPLGHQLPIYELHISNHAVDETIGKSVKRTGMWQCF